MGGLVAVDGGRTGMMNKVQGGAIGSAIAKHPDDPIGQVVPPEKCNETLSSPILATNPSPYQNLILSFSKYHD